MFGKTGQPQSKGTLKGLIGMHNITHLDTTQDPDDKDDKDPKFNKMRVFKHDLMTVQGRLDQAFDDAFCHNKSAQKAETLASGKITSGYTGLIEEIQEVLKESPKVICPKVKVVVNSAAANIRERPRSTHKRQILTDALIKATTEKTAALVVTSDQSQFITVADEAQEYLDAAAISEDKEKEERQEELVKEGDRGEKADLGMDVDFSDLKL